MMLQILARLEGFEPPTAWFVARYSIQLSYSREERNYSTAKRHRYKAIDIFLFSDNYQKLSRLPLEANRKMTQWRKVRET